MSNRNGDGWAMSIGWTRSGIHTLQWDGHHQYKAVGSGCYAHGGEQQKRRWKKQARPCVKWAGMLKIEVPGEDWLTPYAPAGAQNPNDDDEHLLLLAQFMNMSWMKGMFSSVVRNCFLLECWLRRKFMCWIGKKCLKVNLLTAHQSCFENISWYGGASFCSDLIILMKFYIRIEDQTCQVWA